MANSLSQQVGRYWVLYLQPLPEAGERIALALVIDDPQGPTVLYDPKFAKVRKLYPELDADTLQFYMNSLDRELRSGQPADIETVMNSYGPQISASTPRRIALPASESAEMLLSKYIFPGRSNKPRKADPHVSKEIEAFVRAEAGSNFVIKTDVRALDIVGHSVPGTKNIALAIPAHAGRWTLIDGVDLNYLTPKAVVSRADEIGRTYWNYHRAAEQAGLKIRSVGIVLNGRSHLAPATHEAHDYALHRFTSDSDVAIDTESTESGERLRAALIDTSE
jgi:hypothetical protein